VGKFCTSKTFSYTDPAFHTACFFFTLLVSTKSTLLKINSDETSCTLCSIASRYQCMLLTVTEFDANRISRTKLQSEPDNTSSGPKDVKLHVFTYFVLRRKRLIHTIYEELKINEIPCCLHCLYKVPDSI
jgi:hypothetical protein